MPAYILPFGFIMVRVIGGLALFFITGAFVKEKIERKDWWRIVGLAFFGVALNQLLFYKGLNLSSPINASIMMISNPIIVLILMAFIGGERISGRKVVGIALGIAGALTLLLVNKNFSLGSASLGGDTLILINSASWAIYTIMVKPLMQKYSTVTILKWSFLFGLVCIWPVSYPEFHQIAWQAMPLKVILCVSFVVICTTFIAYLLNTYALKELSPSVVSIYIYLQPFLASLIAIGLGQDQLDPIKVSSGLLIIAGVALVTMQPGKRRTEVKSSN